MKRLLLIFSTGIFCFLASHSLVGQVSVAPNPTVDRMMDRYVEVNKEQNTLKGYRIQIYATIDRGQFDNFKRSFEYRYPNISTNWVHSNPYYQLRVGAFASRSEAARMLHILKKDYPNAYFVIDNKIRAVEILD